MAAFLSTCTPKVLKPVPWQATTLRSTPKTLARPKHRFNNSVTFTWQTQYTSPFSTLCRLNKSIQKCRLLNQKKFPHFEARRNAYKYKKGTAFNIDANVPKDTLVYAYSYDKYYRRISYFSFVMSFGLITQSIFTQLDSAKVGIRDIDVPVEERTQWQRYKSWILRNQWNILSVTYALAAVGLIFISHFYVRRTVTKLWLLRGGENIKIEAYSHFGKRRSVVVPLDDTDFKMPRKFKGVQISFKVKNERMYYMIDKQDGIFHEPDLFDFVICLSRVLKKT